MKKAVIIGVIIALVLTLGSIAISANTEPSDGEAMAQVYQQALTSDETFVVAEYNGHEVTAAAVTYAVQMDSFLQGDAAVEAEIASTPEQKALEEILENNILLEEAERLGLTATEEEIEAMVENNRISYTIPEGKEFLDDYCAELGIAFEAYLETVHEQAPRVIARQKLRDQIGRAYCEEHGLTFTKVNPPEELTDAIDSYVKNLVQTKKSEITYYTETAVAAEDKWFPRGR